MENFILLIEYIAIIITSVVLVFRTNYVLNIFQANNYDASSIKKAYESYYLKKFDYFIFIGIIFTIFLDKWYVQIVYILYMGSYLYLILKDKNRGKLKSGLLVYVYYLIILVIGTIIASSMFYYLPMSELVSGIYFIVLIMPIIITFTYILIYPIHLLIWRKQEKNQSSEDDE